jgi:SpoVK/Ycf46/Vps4 family AAA+-type ATPase
MLNFSNFLKRAGENYYRTYFGLNSDSCRYLLLLHKHSKTFKLEDEIYYGIIESLGFDGLTMAAEYIKRQYKKHLSKDAEPKQKKLIESKINAAINEKKKNPYAKRWEILSALITGNAWLASVDGSSLKSIDDVFYLLLKFLRFKSYTSQNSNKCFEKRLDLLCNTLGLCEASKEFLRLTYLMDYSDFIKDLVKNVYENFNCRYRINYAALGILINQSEDYVLEIVSGERGLRNLGIVNGSDLEIPIEIRKYLKGLGSDNLTDIYASVDKRPPLPLEKFECQKDAKFIIDLISIHENNRPLHFLLYGMEGTGKTELARTIAANANCELLDIGRDVKKQVLDEPDALANSIARFRIRALTMAETALSTKKNLVLLMDEADSLLNHFEKGTLNQMLEDMRLPIIWISNSLLWVQHSTMRRFNYSIEFKANNLSARQRLWENVVEKHDASSVFTLERIKTLAEKYEAAPGGIELAVSSEMLLAKAGKKEPVAELVLKQHSELLGLRNSYKNMQSRAPKYDESVLNVQGMEKAIYAAKCYAELLKNKKTESNCTMLLYGAPGTGKTEFARYMARECGLPFKEISYGKISSMFVGQTEKQLAAAFEEASEEGALLFIDEADSLVSDRRRTVQSWETTQVNEFLIQLENSKCLVLCSTNFQGKLDTASNRRFHFHLKFDWLKEAGILKMAKNFFPELENENWAELLRLECLAPGDFYAVHKKLQWLPKEELSAALIIKELSEAAMAKEAYGNRRIGF